VSDDPEWLLRRMDAERTPPTDPRVRDVASVCTDFDRAMHSSWLNRSIAHAQSFMTYELTSRVADEVVTLARNLELGARRVLGPFTTYVGPIDPYLLILGDTRGPSCDDARAPAFGPYPGTSGAYLLDALVRAYPALCVNGVFHRLTRIGLANACDVDDWYALWRALGKPDVVLLGTNAQRRVRADVGIHASFVKLPHPQWMRRFHHHRQIEYGRQLLGVDRPRDVMWWNSTRSTRRESAT
jgi:hypothetical protein